MAYTTAHCGLYWEGKVEEGETVLITGSSGAVSLAAIDIAKSLGARVIAVASSPERLAVAKEHGADAEIDYSAAPIKEAVMNFTDGRGVNVAFDPVMGSLYQNVLGSLDWDGWHVIIGFAGGKIPQIPSNRILVKNRRARGMVMSYYRYRRPELMQRTVQTLFRWYEAGKIHPHITRTRPLEKARDFLVAIIGRKPIGRAILEI